MILMNTFFIQQFRTQVNIRVVFFKELRKVDLGITLIALLIKINGPKPEVDLIEIGNYLYDEVIATNVSQ